MAVAMCSGEYRDRQGTSGTLSDGDTIAILGGTATIGVDTPCADRRPPWPWRCASGMRHGAERAHEVLSSGPVEGVTKVVDFHGFARLGQVWGASSTAPAPRAVVSRPDSAPEENAADPPRLAYGSLL